MRRAGAALVLAAALAGCGGSSHPPAVAKPPRLPRALAHAWASESSAVAQALAAGDGCTALAQANALRAGVDGAAGEIPVRLRATLQPMVDALPGRITCNPPPSPPPPKHEDHPKPPKHDHGHGHEH